MLGKLLKYDLKSVWRIWWIAAVSAFGASFVGAFGLRFFLTGLFNTPTGEMSQEITLVMVLSLIVCGLAILAIVASVLLTEILVYWRFYKHFFSDEGYLTFTLPVRRRTLLLSKTLNAMIWIVAHALLLGVCLLVFLLIAPPALEDGGFFNPIALKTVGKAIAEVFESMGAKWASLYALATLLILAGVVVFSISMVHFCITLGAVIAKKAKLLAAIGMYYLITTVISFVCQAVMSVIGIFMAGRFFLMIIEMTPNEIGWVFWLITMLIATVMAALASTMYFLTLGNLERKLNLA